MVKLTDQRGYVYATHAAISPPTGTAPYTDAAEKLGRGRTATDCPETVRPGGTATGAFSQSERAIAFCVSHATGFYGEGWQGYGVRRPGVGFFIRFPFPFLLAAVDPTAEAKLDGVSKTIVGGRYLNDNDAPRSEVVSGTSRVGVPVIVSTRPYEDDSDQVTVRELPTSAAQAMVHDRTFGQVDAHDRASRSGAGRVAPLRWGRTRLPRAASRDHPPADRRRAELLVQRPDQIPPARATDGGSDSRCQQAVGVAL